MYQKWTFLSNIVFLPVRVLTSIPEVIFKFLWERSLQVFPVSPKNNGKLHDIFLRGKIYTYKNYLFRPIY